MYIKGKYNWLKHVDFMVIDLLALVCSFSVSYYLKFEKLQWWIEEEWQLLLLSLCLLDLVVTFLDSRFSGVLRRRLYKDIIVSALHVLYMIACTSFAFYIFKVGSSFSREMLIVMYVCYYFVGVITRYIWRKIICKRRVSKKKNLYVVCNSDEKNEIIAHLLEDDMESFQIVGTSTKDGFLEDLLTVGAKEVFIALNPGCISQETYEKLIANGIGIHMNIESVIGFQTEEQLVTRVGLYKTLSVGVFSFTPRQMFYISIKRVFDILCGMIGLVVLIPLSLVVKVAYLSKGDKKSIYYTQDRVGKDGRIIKIYKFRSMVANADEVLQEMLKEERYRKEWEETQKFENDPRITKVGNFLRKTSLDEIPQLINVLKGEMSLVGEQDIIGTIRETPCVYAVCAC